MGYELIPVKVVKYVMTAKEVAKFLKGKQKWYTFEERTPRGGEMIHSNMSDKTWVVTSDDENYIREEYTDVAKKHYKYTVLTKRNKYHIIWKVIYVNF